MHKYQNTHKYTCKYIEIFFSHMDKYTKRYVHICTKTNTHTEFIIKYTVFYAKKLPQKKCLYFAKIILILRPTKGANKSWFECTCAFSHFSLVRFPNSVQCGATASHKYCSSFGRKYKSKHLHLKEILAGSLQTNPSQIRTWNVEKSAR